MTTKVDIRLNCSLPEHPKTLKLIRRLGAGAAWSLVKLWAWAGLNRTDGDLVGLTDEDIEIAANWTGDAGALVSALVDVRFVDGAAGARQLHDWAEHQPWVSDAGNRSEQSRWAALCGKKGGRARAAQLMPEYAARLDAEERRRSAARSGTADSSGKHADSEPAASGPHAAGSEPHADRSESQRPASEPHAPLLSSPLLTLPREKLKQKTCASPSASTGREKDLGPIEWQAFWAAYPSTKGRKDALKAWRKLDPDTALVARIMAAVAAQSQWQDWRKQGGQYVPHAATWLNGAKWEDSEPKDGGATLPAADDDFDDYVARLSRQSDVPDEDEPR